MGAEWTWLVRKKMTGAVTTRSTSLAWRCVYRKFFPFSSLPNPNSFPLLCYRSRHFPHTRIISRYFFGLVFSPLRFLSLSLSFGPFVVFIHVSIPSARPGGLYAGVVERVANVRETERIRRCVLSGTGANAQQVSQDTYTYMCVRSVLWLLFWVSFFSFLNSGPPPCECCWLRSTIKPHSQRLSSLDVFISPKLLKSNQALASNLYQYLRPPKGDARK